MNWASPGKADDVRVIRSRADGKFYLFVQRPVVLFGQTLGHITVRNDLTGVIHDNLRAILGVELINFVILLLAAVVLLALLNRIAMKPLLFVQRSVREYKENKDSNTVVSYTEQIRSKNEVGILARDVRDMAVELDRFTEEVGKLSSEKEKLNTELSVSASIQAQMIPHDFPAFPERGEFSLFASMTPAKEVGGDFYDFFLIDEDHLALVMGDVSGKGIPAALFMMVSMTMIQNTALAKRGDSPAAILNEVNDLLYRNNETMMFVMVWFAILTLSTGRMVETNAGHEYPLLKKRGGEYEILKRKHSFVMGVRPGAHYTDDEIQMEKGDAVFIYTDGLPDATNAAGERLEEERMIEVVNRHKEEEPEPLLRSIHEEVNAYVGEAPQFDDLTMLCVTWVGRD